MPVVPAAPEASRHTGGDHTGGAPNSAAAAAGGGGGADEQQQKKGVATESTSSIQTCSDVTAQVLVVEDSPLTRKLIAKTLDALEVTHDSCENGQIAVDRIRQGLTYNLILMDKEMVSCVFELCCHLSDCKSNDEMLV